MNFSASCVEVHPKESNDLGLFDVLGNAFECCQERPGSYRPDRNGLVSEQKKQ
jgi:hypothetical protein